MVDNWNKVDETCPHCNSITKRAVGLNKQNLKRLLFSKPSAQDITIFILMISVLLLGWSYSAEVENYRNYIDGADEACLEYYSMMQSSKVDGNFKDACSDGTCNKSFDSQIIEINATVPGFNLNG